MAIGQIVTNYKAEYSENVLPYNSNFEKVVTINKTSGSVDSYAVFSTDKNYDGLRSIKCYNDDIVTPLVFNLGSSLETTTTKQGQHILSLRLQHEDVIIYNNILKVNIFVDGVLKYTMDCGMAENDNAIDKNKWHCFAQSFNFGVGQVVNFSFELLRVSTLLEAQMFFDALKLEYDDRYLGTPSIYSKPIKIEQNTGFQSRKDTVGGQILTDNIDNLISFTGTLFENGGLNLLNTNAKITPIQVGDMLTLDFAFNGLAPSGSNNYLVVSLKSNGVVFRSVNLPIIKGVGENDNFSVSWSLPVGADFLLYGAELYINPTAIMTIENRYIVVSRTHKSI